MVEAVVSGSEVGEPVIPVAISNPEKLQVTKCESCPPIFLLTPAVATTCGGAACPARPNSLSHNNLERLLHSEIFSGEVGLLLSITYSIMGLWKAKGRRV